METQTQTAKPNALQEFILSIFRHGTSVCGVIMGRRETGKTDSSLYITETVFNFGVIQHIATNIKIFETPPGMKIEQINDAETLEYWAKVNAGKKLYILDEAGKALRRRTPMSKLNIELLDKLQTLRKYKLSLIMIVPAEKYIDGASLGSDVLDFVVFKPEFQNQKVGDYYDVMRNTSKSFYDLPGTNIKFDTWDIAPFKLKAPTDAKAFPTKAIEIAYKNAKEGTTARELGLYDVQLSRYRKEAIIYLVEKYLTPNID